MPAFGYQPVTKEDEKEDNYKDDIRGVIIGEFW
jgi:hypothetical protein